MMMTQGSWSRAYPNILHTTRADSLMYLPTMAEETTLRKLGLERRGLRAREQRLDCL
jgi:hypothetical protein